MMETTKGKDEPKQENALDEFTTLQKIRRENTEIGCLPQMYSRPVFRRSVTLPSIGRNNKTCASRPMGRLRPGQQPAPPTTIKPRNFGGNKNRDPNMRLNALNRTFEPIPTFLETKDEVKRTYNQLNVDFWRNQITKNLFIPLPSKTIWENTAAEYSNSFNLVNVRVVPDRPDYAITSDWIAPPAVWDDRDPYIFSTKSCFYDNKKYVPYRDFEVNPEWISEKMKVSKNSPAYQTCALRYGWCC